MSIKYRPWISSLGSIGASEDKLLSTFTVKVSLFLFLYFSKIAFRRLRLSSINFSSSS